MLGSVTTGQRFVLQTNKLHLLLQLRLSVTVNRDNNKAKSHPTASYSSTKTFSKRCNHAQQFVYLNSELTVACLRFEVEIVL